MFSLPRDYWGWALSLSLLIHSVFLIGLPRVFFNRPPRIKKSQEVKIYPQEIKKILQKEIVSEFKGDYQPPPFINSMINRYLFRKDGEVSLEKKLVLEDELREIVVETVSQREKLEKFPPYMNYYNMIRERIRANAYKYYTCQEKGEVFLSFVVNSDGQLGGIYLNKNFSSKNKLVKIAFKSIKEASPFPPFPEELKFSKLQFNISIYFKNN